MPRGYERARLRGREIEGVRMYGQTLPTIAEQVDALVRKGLPALAGMGEGEFRELASALAKASRKPTARQPKLRADRILAISPEEVPLFGADISVAIMRLTS